MIEVDRLSKAFGSVAALSDVSFRIGAGERVALVGRNGAGKTTLLRVLSTFLPADSGEARIAGFDLFEEAGKIRRVVGYLPESAPLDPTMCVADYLRFRGTLWRMPRRTIRLRLRETTTLCDIASLKDTRIETLSCGQRHAVGLADALLHEPSVLLLDDPLSASDPVRADRIARTLASPEVSNGRVLVFATHSAELIRLAATRVLFLEKGHLLADVPAASIAPGDTLAALFDRWLKEARTREGAAS